MRDDDLKQRAIALFDRFTHEHGDRRAFMRDLGLLAGGTAAAEVLLSSIAAIPAAATVLAADDRRLKATTAEFVTAEGRRISGYRVEPAEGATEGRPAVMVIHENRGLTDHIRDVARRVALLGYHVVAPDFLAPVGGTPVDEDAARTAIGKLDLGMTVSDAIATLDWLELYGAPRTAAIGFCWGGAMVNRLAVAAGPALAAGIAYYGPAPDPSEATRVKAAMLLHYAGLDDRVNATGRPWAAALQAAGVEVEDDIYPGVNHAFNNDTAVGRYDKAASELAWTRTGAFLAKHIGKGRS